MEHDPLCPSSPANSPELKWCDCDFINMVRADEREKAAQRVAALTSWTDDNSPLGPDRVCRYLSAVDAALGEEQ